MKDFSIKKLIAMTVLMLALLPQVTMATIVELDSYKNLDVSQIDQKTWVVFDVDNTLLSPTHMIGSHQWGDYRKELYLKKGFSKEEASKKQLEDFDQVLPAVRPKLVERNLPALIRQLNQKSVPVHTLTARGQHTSGVTLKQLMTVGLLKFNWSSFNFSGGVAKGETLLKMINQAREKPTKVIFIDDKDYNVASVDKTLSENGVDVTAYRYGGVDHEVEAFDPEIADLQYEIFLRSGKILTDEEIYEKLHGEDKIAM